MEEIKKDDQTRDYPAYYYVFKDELLDFLPSEEAKEAFLFSLGSWLAK